MEDFTPLTREPTQTESVPTKDTTPTTPTPFTNEAESAEDKMPLSLYYTMNNQDNIAASELEMDDDIRMDWNEAREKFFSIDMYIKTQMQLKGLQATVGAYKQELSKLMEKAAIAKEMTKLSKMDRLFMLTRNNFAIGSATTTTTNLEMLEDKLNG